MEYTFFGRMTIQGDRVTIKLEEKPYLKVESNSVKSAVKEIEEDLGQKLLAMEIQKKEIPEPNGPMAIILQPGETIVTLSVDTDIIRERNKESLIKKTLTIPEYLNTFGVKMKLNFSKLLTDALTKEISRESDYLNEKKDIWIDIDQIDTDEVLSEETLKFINERRSSRPITHQVIKKRNSAGVIYYVFKYIEGTAVMNWGPKDYQIAEKQIYIGDIPIVMELPDSGHKYYNISLSYRE